MTCCHQNHRRDRDPPAAGTDLLLGSGITLLKLLLRCAKLSLWVSGEVVVAEWGFSV
jgi:hypothetical protein